MNSPVSKGGVGNRRSSVLVTEWTVSDFKSLEYVTLPLTHFVLLTGANSSGKSSVIQSLLLLAQSSEDELILNGPLVRLGEPKDVIRSGRSSVSFGFTCQVRRSQEEAKAEWSFEMGFSTHGQDLQISSFHAAVDGNPVLAATNDRLNARTRNEVDPDGRFGDSLLRVQEIRGKAEPSRTYVSFRGFHPEALLYNRQPKQVLSSLRRTYSKKALKDDPERLIDLYSELLSFQRLAEGGPEFSEIRKKLNSLLPTQGRSLNKEMDQGQLDDMFVEVSDHIGGEWRATPIVRFMSGPGYQARFVSRRPPGTLGLQDQFSDAIRCLALAEESLRSIRESIRYLGPLREEPQVVSATGARYRNVPAGSHGEYTADLLARSKNRNIPFRDHKRRLLKEKLPDAVSLWTAYLGVGETVGVEDQGKLGRGLRITVNGIPRDLTTIGVGASQLLPVITIVLAADAGSIVMLEQPELHLHPAVQSRLADFFLFARPDVTLIVETHSEYLVTRMRRRAAEGSIGGDKVALMFAEQIDGTTQVRRLHMDSLGDLDVWPAGFFDTQEEESRALVAAISKKISTGRP